MKKLLLTLGAVASVAAPVAAVVACSNDNGTTGSEGTITLHFGLKSVSAEVKKVAAVNGQVGDAKTNHPVRVILAAADADKIPTNLMDELNTKYDAANADGNGVLNTPKNSGPDNGNHAGWEPFFAGSRKGVSTAFGFDAGATEHIEILLNFKTAEAAASATKESVESIINGLLVGIPAAK